MIPLLPLILLLVRFFDFRRLRWENLPNLKESDVQKMKRHSGVALAVMAVFSGASCYPYFSPKLIDKADQTALVLVIVGLCIAAVFDLRAELLKRKGKRKPAKAPVTKATAMWKVGITFVGYCILIFIVEVLVTIGILNVFEIKSIPSIPNAIIRGITWVTVIALPPVLSFLMARRRYRSFDIVTKP